jgi:ribosomal protein S18 acetylase RimI-like enzyme
MLFPVLILCGVLFMIQFITVQDDALIKRTADLARVIWSEHYPSIISHAQIEYMLAAFQSPKAIEKQVRQDGLLYFLVTDEVHDLGYFAVQYREKELFISKFYLEKTTRGSGLARKILVYIEGLAAQKGLSHITLTTHKQNKVALQAYEGLGFKIFQPVVTEIGEGYVMDDYRLEKMIVSPEA